MRKEKEIDENIKGEGGGKDWEDYMLMILRCLCYHNKLPFSR